MILGLIARKFRLTEDEVKRAIKKGKPFFSRIFTVIIFPNNCDHNRFAVSIGSKSTKFAVTRNLFRRVAYDLCASRISSFVLKDEKFYDFIFLLKKQTKLDKKDVSQMQEYKSDIEFCFEKLATLDYQSLGNKVTS